MTWWYHICFLAPQGIRLRLDVHLGEHPCLASPPAVSCFLHFLTGFTWEHPLTLLLGNPPNSMSRFYNAPIWLPDKTFLRRTSFLSLVREKVCCYLSTCHYPLDIAHSKRRHYFGEEKKKEGGSRRNHYGFYFGIWVSEEFELMERNWTKGLLTSGPTLFPQLTHCLSVPCY